MQLLQQKEHPTLSLDIYGQGGEESKLNAIIKELNAEEYIQLKGHSHAINEVYPNYDAFISGSFQKDLIDLYRSIECGITNCDVQGTFWGDGVDQRRGQRVFERLFQK